MKKEIVKRVKPHFEIPEDQWNALKEKTRQRNSNNSIFLREKITEFLAEDSPADSPLTRYHKIYCEVCENINVCKNDKGAENSCILARLFLCFSRWIHYGRSST